MIVQYGYRRVVVTSKVVILYSGPTLLLLLSHCSAAAQMRDATSFGGRLRSVPGEVTDVPRLPPPPPLEPSPLSAEAAAPRSRDRAKASRNSERVDRCAGADDGPGRGEPSPPVCDRADSRARAAACDHRWWGHAPEGTDGTAGDASGLDAPTCTAGGGDET